LNVSGPITPDSDARGIDVPKVSFQARLLLAALFQPNGITLDEIDCTLEKRTKERLAHELHRAGLVEPDGGRRHRRWFPSSGLIELAKSLISANPPVFDNLLTLALNPKPGQGGFQDGGSDGRTEDLAESGKPRQS
jgi:hypothetical protein